MLVSVVVASKNRPALLDRLLRTLAPQVAESPATFEFIVVDDGSQPPYEPSDVLPVTLVRTEGLGPGRARNRGVRAAHGEIVLFTDDDALPEPGWVAAALAYLAAHPESAGVTGDTSSPPFDPLYEHSVQDHVGGSFLTCNVAYRRAALDAVGGFDERLSHAHEDRDLAWRIADEVGPVGVEPRMRVTHPGRPVGVRETWRRARFVHDDWLLFARYPERRSGRHSIRWTPVANTVATWRDLVAREALWRHPRRAARAVVLAGGQIAVGTWLTLTTWRRLAARDTRVEPGLRRRGRRIAYVGPSPHPTAGGAPGVAGLLLDELLRRGHVIDCFVAASREDDDPRGLGERDGLTYVLARSPFAFGHWYSNHRVTKMITVPLFAALTRRRLAGRLAALHRASPYDLVYQFSTFESVGVPRRRAGLPVIIHPSVHAAGERRWVRRESGLDLSDDARWRTRLVLAWLSVRALRQRADARRATGILALSRRFGDEIAADYGVDPTRIKVVPNCIDVDAVTFATPRTSDLMVVGRWAVRKGLEDVVALSEVLSDVDERVRLRLIGAPSLWSDYRRAVGRADATVTVLEGPRTRAEVFDEVGGALALLQLSRYEPFGLTVAEALALGVPVIVTPAVGAAEAVSDDVKIVVSPGRLDELTAAVSSLVALRDDERLLLAHRCRREAERHFRPAVVADALEAAWAALLS